MAKVLEFVTKADRSSWDTRIGIVRETESTEY